MSRSLRKTASALPLLAMFGLLTGALGCDPSIKEGGPNVPGGEHGAQEGPVPSGQQSDNSFPSLKARLHELKGKQHAAAASAMQDVQQCEDLCDLATKICEVAERLAVIADRHPQEESYQSLKREAQLECREATQSCINCVGGFEKAAPNSTEPDTPPATDE